MTHYIHYTDPNSGEMEHQLSSIPRCPGICFFMDINRSTDLKYLGGLNDWGRKLNNTFNNLLYANHFHKHVVKGIGDEMMLYIPDEALFARKSNNNCYAIIEDIYAALFMIKHHPDQDLYLNCKVAIHYCTEAYNITFFEHADDYYGSDIDLTARLMTKSVENRIVLSEKYYRKVISDLETLGMPPNSGCLEQISEKFLENFRGVPVSTEYRIIEIQ
jgi:class 3 adenylate cyclase